MISAYHRQHNITHKRDTLQRRSCCYRGAPVPPAYGPPLHHAPRNLGTQGGEPGVSNELDPEATYGGSYYNWYKKTYLAVAVVEGGFPGWLAGLRCLTTSCTMAGISLLVNGPSELPSVWVSLSVRVSLCGAVRSELLGSLVSTRVLFTPLPLLCLPCFLLLVRFGISCSILLRFFRDTVTTRR